MITFKTYLRKLIVPEALDEHSYFSINDQDEIERNKDWFDGSPIMYIPGYIEVLVYGVKISSFKDWDYPLYMWMNIVNGLCGLTNGSGLSIDFLEEPKSYKFQNIDKENCLIYIQSDYNGRISTSDKFLLHRKLIEIALLTEIIIVLKVLSQYDNGDYLVKASEMEKILGGISQV